MNQKITAVVLASLFLFLSSLTPSFLGSSTEGLDSQNKVIGSFVPTTSPLGGSRYSIQGWVYVNIKGAPYERGYQYGFLLADEIIDLMYRWSHMICNHPSIQPIRGMLSQEKYDQISQKWWDFCGNTAKRMYWEQYPLEYQEEMKGIAAGVNERGVTLYGSPISYQDVLASNEMYEVLSKLTDNKIREGVHPLYSFFQRILPDIQQYSQVSSHEFVAASLVDTFPMHHHCSSFIATGDATRYNELIISNSMWSTSDGIGMWWWSHYIAIRWNIVLDVIPEDGHRFQMTCAPGYIWSDHDFYQNSKGIVFIETTVPQGLWSERGLPLAVRARTAVQYAESIDDVIDILRTQNDGIMNAVWLIGDTKTGEIARYELGLYNDAVIFRGFDGFHWSSNNPMDLGVRLEKLDFKELIHRLINYIVLGLQGYEYYTPWYVPAARDIAFEELGQLYYGDIDIEVVKEIMRQDPIGTHSPDCKITSTSLVSQNGLCVLTGNPAGVTFEMLNYNSPQVITEEILPVGWLCLYGLPDDTYGSYEASLVECSTKPTPTWSYTTNAQRNDHRTQNIVINNTIYSTDANGMLTAIDAGHGDLLWEIEIGKNPTMPVYYNHSLYIGTYDGLVKFDLGWMTLGKKPLGTITCPPVVSDNMVYVGTEDGKMYAFTADTGVNVWQKTFNDTLWLAKPSDDIVVVGAGNVVYALQQSNGEIVWSFDTNGPITIPPLVDEKTVYVGSWDTTLYAINGSSGVVRWAVQTGFGIETTPCIMGSVLIFGSHDGVLYAVNKTTGNIYWTQKMRSGIHVSPVALNQRVYVGSDDGRCYCFDSVTGTPLWVFAPERTISAPQSNYFTTAFVSNLIVDDGILYLHLHDTYYAIHD